MAEAYELYNNNGCNVEVLIFIKIRTPSKPSSTVLVAKVPWVVTIRNPTIRHLPITTIITSTLGVILTISIQILGRMTSIKATRSLSRAEWRSAKGIRSRGKILGSRECWVSSSRLKALSRKNLKNTSAKEPTYQFPTAHWLNRFSLLQRKNSHLSFMFWTSPKRLILLTTSEKFILMNFWSRCSTSNSRATGSTLKNTS